MNNENQITEAQLHLVAQDMIYTLSGAYCSEFWDCMNEVCGSLETIKAIKTTLETLHNEKKDNEAFQLLLALYDIISLETPAEIIEIEAFKEAVPEFIGEFIEDSIDLMYDYEAEAINDTIPAWS